MEREVMEAIYHAFQHWMLCACLAGLGMIAALVFLAKVAAPAWDAVRRWWSLPCIQRVIVAVCVVGLSYYGATKQGWHVAYDGGIKAGATANVVTNDTVSIHWQRDTSGGVYVPESATVYIDYRPNTETNAEWGLLAQTTVGAWSWTGTVENATNYDYNVWAYYIPPEPVHTNGVWTYKTHFDRNGEYALPLRARVEVNGVAIATPAEKRKDTTLPYDSEVAYLESTGTQWIDTETKPSEDLATYITFSYQQIANNVTAFGSRSNSTVNDRYWLNYDSKFEIGYGNWGSAVETTSVGAINTIAFNEIVDGNHTFTVNGRSITSSGTPNTSVNIIVFGRVVGSTAPVLSKMRLYSMSMKRGGVLIHDYIPVRVGTTGELYDRVSKTFATRHGDFQYGSDIEQAKWTDGSYWNTYGTATALTGGSCCENFIPVQPSSSVTFYLGARPGGTTLYMVQYGSDKLRVNSTYNSNGSARTVTIPANCYYIRVSCETAKKNEAYIRDNTNGRYLMLNGKVVVE